MYLQHQHVNQESARAALPGSAEQLCYSSLQGEAQHSDPKGENIPEIHSRQLWRCQTQVCHSAAPGPLHLWVSPTPMSNAEWERSCMHRHLRRVKQSLIAGISIWIHWLDFLYSPWAITLVHPASFSGQLQVQVSPLTCFFLFTECKRSRKTVSYRDATLWTSSSRWDESSQAV